MDAFIQRALVVKLNDNLSVDVLVAFILDTGKYGMAGMDLQNQANLSVYGNSEIAEVNIGVGKNPGILVSVHDFHDLEMLLKQPQGTSAYAHSDILLVNYYHTFKKYFNFVENYRNV